MPESYKRYLANVFRERVRPVRHARCRWNSAATSIPFLKDKPKEKRGLKTSQKERRERRIKKDRAKRPPKKKGGGTKQIGAPRGARRPKTRRHS